MVKKVSVLAKVASALQTGTRQRVTWLGALFTMAAALVAAAAFISANNLLFLILAAMLSTLLVSGLISRLSLAGLELDFILPDHLCARRSLAGNLVVRNAKRLIPSFSIRLAATPETGLTSEIYFPVIPGGARVSHPLELYFARRGSYHRNHFRFSTRFPFGFTERRIDLELRREIVVYPALDTRPSFQDLLASVEGDLDSQQRGRGSDFYRIRPYEAMESARHVDWKATAHTGELQVREFAREREQAVLVALDLNVPESELAWWETAIECCAYLCWELDARGHPVRFLTQEWSCDTAAHGDVFAILKYLALVSPSSHGSLSTPDDLSSVQILFRAAPPDAAEPRVHPATRMRLITPGDLPVEGPESRSETEARAAAHVHHDH